MKKNKKYLNDVDLYYEIVLSKGKGMLTKKAIDMFILIGQKMRYCFFYDYTDTIDQDCFQAGIEMMLLSWNKFDHIKYNKALPYFTELFKRGSAKGYNELTKKHNNNISLNLFYQ